MTDDQSTSEIDAGLELESTDQLQRRFIEALRKAVPKEKAYATIEALVNGVRTKSIDRSIHNGVIGPGGSREHTGTDYTSLFSIEHPIVKTLEYRGISIVRPGDTIVAKLFIGTVVDTLGRPKELIYGKYPGDVLRMPIGDPWGDPIGYHLRELQEKEIITSFEGRTPEGHSYFID